MEWIEKVLENVQGRKKVQIPGVPCLLFKCSQGVINASKHFWSLSWNYNLKKLNNKNLEDTMFLMD